MALTFDDWYQMGLKAGFCSEWVCETHDGLPFTEEEKVEWDNGGDPCCPAVRLYPEGKPEGIHDPRWRNSEEKD